MFGGSYERWVREWTIVNWWKIYCKAGWITLIVSFIESVTDSILLGQKQFEQISLELCQNISAAPPRHPARKNVATGKQQVYQLRFLLSVALHCRSRQLGSIIPNLPPEWVKARYEREFSGGQWSCCDLCWNWSHLEACHYGNHAECLTLTLPQIVTTWWEML